MPGELQIPFWEWWIIGYFFLGGIAGGAYFTSAIIELVGEPEDRPIARMGYYIAFPLALVCALFLALDLGLPLRFWHMLVYSRTLLPWPKWDSPISVGAYALLGFGLFSFLSFVDALVETGRLPWAPLRDKYSGTPRKIYSVLGAISGFFLASYTGVLLATTHLPVWSTNPLLGALFLASGASTGMAAVGLGLALNRNRMAAASASLGGLARLKRADNVAMIVELVLLVAFLALLGTAARPLLVGLNGVLLIGGVLILGLAVPLAMQIRTGLPGGERSQAAHVFTSTGMIVLVSALILLGGLLMRTVIVMGGQGLL